MYRINFFVVFVYHGRLEYPPKRMPNGPSRLRFVRQQNSLQDQRVVYKILKPSWNLVCVRRGTVSTGWYPHCPLWSTLTILSAPSMSSPLMPSLLLFFFILIVALTWAHLITHNPRHEYQTRNQIWQLGRSGWKRKANFFLCFLYYLLSRAPFPSIHPCWWW